MAEEVSFADLMHTSQGYANISFPFGIGLVAAYALQNLDIETAIFKYPYDFNNYLKKNAPKIACFSNYSWTLDLSYEFAKQIKKRNPGTITVFGGPNFPVDPKEQKEFLEYYPGIDFYIEGEGERAFAELFCNFKKFNLNIKDFKTSKTTSGNTYYIIGDELIVGKKLDRIKCLDDIPSPYLNGMMDKFFDGILVPNFQTTRGCPFSCTYCQEGQDYFNQISRFSPQRIQKELEYIAERVDVPQLIISDSNFCMYKEDKTICEIINRIKEKHNGWPKYFEVTLGKKKEMVLDSISLLKGRILLSAPVQSTDKEVLKNIKRKNIPMEDLIAITKHGEYYGASSFSEVILGLPGDSLETHFRSMFDMIDAGINIVRSHQLLMLPGSDLSRRETREKFRVNTRFRLQPRCFGNYEIYGEVVPIAEVDEVCIGNNTMTTEDYLECRKLDLSVEIFHNNKLFNELESLLEFKGIKKSEFVRTVNGMIKNSSLEEVYDGFLGENMSHLWHEANELKEHIKDTKMIDRYINEKSRSNEQLKYRAIVLFDKMDELHNVSFEAARELIVTREKPDNVMLAYLSELKDFSLTRKKDIKIMGLVDQRDYHFDFVRLQGKNFQGDPFVEIRKQKVTIEFSHSDEQREEFGKYLEQFGDSPNGLGLILSKSHVDAFYRQVKVI